MRAHIIVSLVCMVTVCAVAFSLYAHDIKINEILYDPAGGDTGE